MVEIVFLNGRFLPQAEAHLTLHDAGFVMGATVTDLCRTFHHQLYLWPEHLDRFARSCQAAQIYPSLSGDEIDAAARELVAHNARLLPSAQELALVVFCTPGPIGYYLGETGGVGDAPATFGMHTFPLPFARYRRLIRQGASLIVPHIRHVPHESIDPRIKQRSRLHWWLADREVHRQDPTALALLLDQDGHVTETAGANFLLVKNDTVLSPRRERILEGISLGVVRRLCAKMGITFEERSLTLYDCRTADEAMLASTPYCLAGVSHLQGVPLRFPGPMLQRLLQAWSDDVGMDIHPPV